MKKRLISIFMAIALALGIQNVVFAQQTDTDSIQSDKESLQVSDSLDDVLIEADSTKEVLEVLDDADMLAPSEILQDNSEDAESKDTLSEEDSIKEDSKEENLEDYSLRRIILFADGVTESYGASNVIYYDKYGEYVFTFESEQDTEAAYTRMVEEYGEEKCILDQIVYEDDICTDADYEYKQEALYADMKLSTAVLGLKNCAFSVAGEEQISGVLTRALSAESNNESSSASVYEAVGWGCTYMGFDQLKSQASDYTGLNNVTVAVIDSGVYYSADLFSGRIDTLHSYNTFSGSMDYSDDTGHGSHVAGIIADSTPNNVKLAIYKCFEDSRSTYLSIYSALTAAIDDGADVVNMSLCWYGDGTAAKFTYIDNLIEKANNKGTVICVAAGNASVKYAIKEVRDNSYPANSSGVLTVSAIKKDGDTVEFDNTYSFYGSDVNFCAPGTNVLSTWYDGSYKLSSGTSMATPYIAAASAYVKMVEPNVNITGVEKILADYSIDLGATGKDIYYGYGCPYMANYFENSFAESYVGMTIMNDVVNTQSGMKIAWKSVNDVDGYRIYRKGANTGYSVIKYISSQSVTSYIDTTAVAGKTYRYMVKAVKNGKEGEYESTIASVRITQPKVKAVNASKGIVLSWKKCAGATGYKLYRKLSGKTKWTLVKTLSSSKTSYVDTNVVGGKTYVYTMTAVHNSITSTYDVSGTKLYRMSTRPMVSLVSKSKGKMVAKWKVSSGVSGYQIQYSSKANFSTYKLIKIAGYKKNTKTITKLKSKKTYYVRVRSYRTIGGVTYYGGWGGYKKVKVK